MQFPELCPWQANYQCAMGSQSVVKDPGIQHFRFIRRSDYAVYYSVSTPNILSETKAVIERVSYVVILPDIT